LTQSHHLVRNGVFTVVVVVLLLALVYFLVWLITASCNAVQGFTWFG
jgi:hypothetical protein